MIWQAGLERKKSVKSESSSPDQGSYQNFLNKQLVD